MVVIALANNISKGGFVLRAWLELLDKVHFAKEKRIFFVRKNTLKNPTLIKIQQKYKGKCFYFF